MAKSNNQLIQEILQRITKLETQVDDILKNHLKDLRNSQTKITWLLVTTLAGMVSGLLFLILK